MNNELNEFFTSVYNRTYDYIYKFLTVKLDSAEIIQDAVQSVYLDYYKALIAKDPSGIRNHKHYILKIAKAYVADYYDAKGDTAMENIDEIEVADDKTLERLENDVSLDFDNVMSRLRKGDDLTYRIFVLHYQYDYTIKKTASLLGLSQSTVKSRIYRTLEQLRNAYKEAEKNEYFTGNEKGIL